jgi:putative pyrroloquinoline-quinone binding quinoprotein
MTIKEFLHSRRVVGTGVGFVAVLMIALAGCPSSVSQMPSSASAPAITTQPAVQVVNAGQTATFSVVAAGTAPLSYQWQKNLANISGANALSYTTPVTTAGDNGAAFRVVVSNSVGTATSNSATLTVNAAVAAGTDVTTYHNDAARTGQNLTETTLTTTNVNSQGFGLLRNLLVDGKVDAEPLYLSQLSIAGSAHNVVFVATEHDSLYAFDSDTGAQLWKASVLGSGETTSDDRGCGQVTPEIGITSTPVIDRTAGQHGMIYVVAMSKNGSAYFQRLHALDVTTGAEQLGGPVTIQATYPGTGANSSGGQVVFDPKQYEERAGLLLLNGVVYTSWTSHCDINPYTGWIIAYSETSLSQASVLNLTPNGSEGSIWQSGGGLAADAQGSIYALVANGTFDTSLDANGFPINHDYGNAFVRISTSGGTLQVADYFDMFNAVNESGADVDLGSGGAMVVPDFTNGSGNAVHLAVGAGKDGNIYVVDRTNMGKFHASSNNIYQELQGAVPNGVFGVPAYFSGTVYFCDVNATLKSFAISNGKLSATAVQTAASFTYPGVLPSISANGSSNGIVWAIENTGTAVLHAFAANDLTHELYNSNQAENGRDQFGSGNKFITPMIADGKVFAATTNGVAVFGLLP